MLEVRQHAFFLAELLDPDLSVGITGDFDRLVVIEVGCSLTQVLADVALDFVFVGGKVLGDGGLGTHRVEVDFGVPGEQRTGSWEALEHWCVALLTPVLMAFDCFAAAGQMLVHATAPRVPCG